MLAYIVFDKVLKWIFSKVFFFAGQYICYQVCNLSFINKNSQKLFFDHLQLMKIYYCKFKPHILKSKLFIFSIKLWSISTRFIHHPKFFFLFNKYSIQLISVNFKQCLLK